MGKRDLRRGVFGFIFTVDVYTFPQVKSAAR